MLASHLINQLTFVVTLPEMYVPFSGSTRMAGMHLGLSLKTQSPHPALMLTASRTWRKPLTPHTFSIVKWGQYAPGLFQRVVLRIK